MDDEEPKLGNNGEEIVEENEYAAEARAESAAEDEYDQLVDDSSSDLDERLNKVLDDIRREFPLSIFATERRFWRSVMAKAEHELSNVDVIQAGPANMRTHSSTSTGN